MSEPKTRRRPFAHVREAECEALKGLSADAAKLWIAIRFGRDDTRDFSCGCRDFKDWGLKRDRVCKAIGELVAAKLLERVACASFGEKRRRARYRITHTKKSEALQSLRTDKADLDSRSTATVDGATVAQDGQSGSPQSLKSDIPKEASRPSASSQEGREASEGRAQARERSLRIERAAAAAEMQKWAFVEKAGGLEQADFIAKRHEVSKLSAPQLRRALAERANGLENEAASAATARPPDPSSQVEAA